mmetsp:Transcript_92287/g.214426  ORF Transcript_92287/g.214426 Transcript_92287/m.214426 type:complete len:302 (+) Transcript_92287:295-1200(+)
MRIVGSGPAYVYTSRSLAQDNRFEVGDRLTTTAGAPTGLTSTSGGSPGLPGQLAVVEDEEGAGEDETAQWRVPTGASAGLARRCGSGDGEQRSPKCGTRRASSCASRAAAPPRPAAARAARRRGVRPTRLSKPLAAPSAAEASWTGPRKSMARTSGSQDATGGTAPPRDATQGKCSSTWDSRSSIPPLQLCPKEAARSNVQNKGWPSRLAAQGRVCGRRDVRRSTKSKNNGNPLSISSRTRLPCRMFEQTAEGSQRSPKRCSPVSRKKMSTPNCQRSAAYRSTSAKPPSMPSTLVTPWIRC